MSILIKNGRMAELKNNPVVNLLVEEGVITYIGEEERVADQVIDATGYILFPGFIDAHTHLDMDTGTAHTADDFETGTKAAIRGGTTTIIDFATQNKGETLGQALTNWHHKAAGKCSADYGFHMAITDWNREVAQELTVMKAAGITSFKLYLAYDALRVTDGELYQVLREVNRLGGIVGVHCENGDLVNELIAEQLHQGHISPKAHPRSRPDLVEKEAIQRFLDIAYLAEAPAHIVHISTKLGLEAVGHARRRGQEVYVETCPQYLLLDERYYDLEGFESAKYVLSPPLRSQDNVEALWQGIKAGEIDTISTDHCSFHFVGQKEIGRNDFSQIPCGMPGIEHRPQLIATYGLGKGQLSLEALTQLLSTNAAKLFGLYPRKGTLCVGSDADLVVWNPQYKGVITAKEQLQNVDYTPYEGFGVSGRAEHVLLRGQHVVEAGQVVREGTGCYIPRSDRYHE